MPDLLIEGLRVARGAGLVINDLSVRIPEGSTVAIVGRNGAGKSTLLEAIVGLLPSAGGSVLFGEGALHRLSAAKVARAGVALVPEGRHLFPHMTVMEHLALGAHQEKWLWKSPRPAVFDPVWEVFPDLYEVRKHVAGQLSGGQQQMVAVGRALVADPKLLILDEPTFGLSPQLTEKMCDFLVALSSRQRTIVIAEQNVDVAAQVATTMAVMTNGVLSGVGLVEQVMESDEFEAAAYG